MKVTKDVAVAILAAFVKISNVVKHFNQCSAIFTYLILTCLFVLVGSQIHQSVLFIPVSDDRLTDQARLVFHVSHITASGLLVRSCMIGVQFVSQWDVLTQSWFLQGYYFLCDFCVVLLVVASVHKRTRR